MPKRYIISESQFASMLLEAYGVFPGCRELAIRIADEIHDRWKGSIMYPIDIPCYFTLDGLVHVYPTHKNLRAACVLDERLKGKAVIFVNPDILDWDNEGGIIGSLMHELTHAYRNTIKMRYGVGSELKSGQKDGYFKNFDYKFGNSKEDKLRTPIKYYLSEVLYWTNQMEAPAFIAGMYGKLSSSMAEIETYQEAVEVLKATREYKRFQEVFWYAKELTSIDNIWQQDMILGYSRELTGYTFKTYAQLCKYIVGKCRKVRDKLNSYIPKMAAKYLDSEE